MIILSNLFVWKYCICPLFMKVNIELKNILLDLILYSKVLIKAD